MTVAKSAKLELSDRYDFEDAVLQVICHRRFDSIHAAIR